MPIANIRAPSLRVSPPANLRGVIKQSSCTHDQQLPGYIVKYNSSDVNVCAFSFHTIMKVDNHACVSKYKCGPCVWPRELRGLLNGGQGGQSEKHNLFTFSTPKVGPGAVATLDSTTKVIHFDERDRNSRPRLTGAQHCAIVPTKGRVRMRVKRHTHKSNWALHWTRPS